MSYGGSREVTVNRGGNMFEKQTWFTNLVQPVLFVILYVIMTLVYATSAYISAALIGNLKLLDGALTLNVGHLLLLVFVVLWIKVKVFTAGFEMSIKNPHDKIYPKLIVLAFGVFFVILTALGAFEWNYSFGERVSYDVVKQVMWIDTPIWKTYVAIEWVAARFILAICVPIGEAFTAKEILWRILREMGFPNLSDSVRAAPGLLINSRWLTYPREPREDIPMQETPVMVVE